MNIKKITIFTVYSLVIFGLGIITNDYFLQKDFIKLQLQYNAELINLKIKEQENTKKINDTLKEIREKELKRIEDKLNYLMETY